jgi:hypothetical protein
MVPLGQHRLVTASVAKDRDVTTDPDTPAAFGSGLAWIAISADDIADVRRTLAVASARPCNWQTGIGVVQSCPPTEGLLFISPPVDGWVMVAGRALPAPHDERTSNTFAMLMDHLARHFDRVQYFEARSEAGVFAWVAYQEQRLLRAFAFAEDHACWNRGRVTTEEKQIAPELFQLRQVAAAHAADGSDRPTPTEAHVFALAHRWSLDPSTFGTSHSVAPDLGLLARAPEHWASGQLTDAA